MFRRHTSNAEVLVAAGAARLQPQAERAEIVLASLFLKGSLLAAQGAEARTR